MDISQNHLENDNSASSTGYRNVRLRNYILSVIPLVCALAWWGHIEIEESRTEEQTQTLRRMLERMRDTPSEEPGGVLADEWARCLQELQTENENLSRRVTCSTLSGQGVTSELIALKFEDQFVPIVESRIPNLAMAGRIVIDVVGGPGDDPFYSNPAVTAKMVEEFRGNDAISFVGGIMSERPQYQLMKRGFIIASVAYWGTSVRTLAAPNEIEAAMREVGLVIDHYREELGGEPPLVTASLGNHLVLGAVGKERLQSMQVLALVPVMNGLQNHLDNQMVQENWATRDVLSVEWVMRNIYAQREGEVIFDHRRAIDQREFVPRYIGGFDLPWRYIKPERACSAIILGDSDPRNEAYLATGDGSSANLQVWESGHDLYRDAPQQVRLLFADFADCLLTGES